MPRHSALAVLALAVAVGCSRAPEEPAALPPADAVYELEGVVYSVPGPDTAGGEIVIHHQAVPEFASREGETVGMDSMTMPFAVAPGVELAGIEKGDPVRFTFELRWDVDPTTLVAAIEELPAGTEIDWENAPDPVGGEAIVGEAGIEGDEDDGWAEGDAPGAVPADEGQAGAGEVGPDGPER